jgi:heparan-alpha-glucosaminide N-acetyltransferase
MGFERSNRILSIDIMRGFNLVLMLFVNDLYIPGVPEWLGHTKADVDGMGLADWVFPGFMFMVGMSIPYSVGNRITREENRAAILKHILIRAQSLLIIGLLMANSRNVNAEYTGMTKSLWSMIMYTSVFLIWFNYAHTKWNTYTIYGLQLLGFLMIVSMVYIFRSEGDGAFRFNSWGILGTIGWGSLVAGLVYMWFRDNISKTVLCVIIFLILNILSNLHLLDFLGPLRKGIGPVINGNAPFIVLSGMLITLILKNHATKNAVKTVLIIATLGLLSIAAGFILRPWFIISKIQATPTWGLICNGITMLLFALLFWIIDIMKKVKWSRFLRPAGANSLTVYLVPDMFYYIIWQFSLPFLFYKHLPQPGLVILGSIVWALVMGVGLPIVLEKINFRLKL